MNRDEELWALAQWVEKHQGANGPRFIAEKMGRFALDGDAGAIEMWKGVAARYDQLGRQGAQN